jgi:hypothetical protein
MKKITLETGKFSCTCAWLPWRRPIFISNPLPSEGVAVVGQLHHVFHWALPFQQLRGRRGSLPDTKGVGSLIILWKQDWNFIRALNVGPPCSLVGPLKPLYSETLKKSHSLRSTGATTYSWQRFRFSNNNTLDIQAWTTSEDFLRLNARVWPQYLSCLFKCAARPWTCNLIRPFTQKFTLTRSTRPDQPEQ